MKKNLLFRVLLLLIVIPSDINAAPSDSLKISSLEKRIVEGEIKNKNLEEKIILLSSTNDKVFSAFYTLLGILVTAVISAGVWNTIQNWKLNTVGLKNAKDTIHNDLEKLLMSSIDSRVADIYRKFDSKYDLNKIETDILDLRATFLKHLILSYKFYNAHPDMNMEYTVLCQLLNITIEKEKLNPFYYYNEVEDVLKAILAYLDANHVMNDHELEQLYGAIRKVPTGSNDLYLNKIKKKLDIDI